MSNSWGPLPKADDNSELQRKSFNKIQNCLPSNRFVFRDEPNEDAGVDASIELLFEDQYTNMRSQLQIKGRFAKNANADGTVTYDIETSNFNYLLNHGEGIYFLYIDETEELFFAFATDELRRRQNMPKSWKEQKTIRIYMRPLSTDTLNEIYDRIMTHCRMRRDISDVLARETTSKTINFHISTDTLNVTDPEEIKNILLDSGFALVAAGYSQNVLDKLRMISLEAASNSLLKLLEAYANFQSGYYQKSWATTSDILAKASLDEMNKRFAQQLHLGSQQQLGLVSKEDFHQELNAIAKGTVALDVEVNFYNLLLKYRQLQWSDNKVMNEIEEFKKGVLSDTEISTSTKLKIKSGYVEMIGMSLAQKMLNNALLNSARSKNPQLTNLRIQQQEIQEIERLSKYWIDETANIVSEAEASLHPLCLAEALTTHARIQTQLLISDLSLRQFLEIGDDLDVEEKVHAILELCKNALGSYDRLGNIEGQIRINLLMAELLTIISPEEAKNKVYDVLPIAKIYSLRRHIDSAKDLLAGQSMFARQTLSSRQALVSEQRGLMPLEALSTEGEIEELTDFIMETHSLPLNRRENVRLEALCTRDVNLEKHNWCRHIDVLQDTSHQASSETVYTINPPRVVICRMYNHQSAFTLPDWKVLLSVFKESYCSCCEAKSPVS